MSILIISDGRKGHLNQSVALAKYLQEPYDIVEVTFAFQGARLLSYVYDWLGLSSTKLFRLKKEYAQHYKLVIGAGSSTYYPVKVLAKSLGAKSVSMMLPKGYRYNFDCIYAPLHDTPPEQANIVPIPANFSYLEPLGVYRAKRDSVGIVIGGDSRYFTLPVSLLKRELDSLFARYAKHYEMVVTTSPRTSKEIETLLASYDFAYRVTYSQNPINPMGDFLEQCEVVYCTMDSTSMISEAVSYGKSRVVVLPLPYKKENKYSRFVSYLKQEGYLCVLKEEAGCVVRKIDFLTYSKKVEM